MKYNDDFEYPEAEPLEIEGNVYTILIHPDHAPLRYRREQMGMSQAEVAEKAGIALRQYQRFESGERRMTGASMRIGLAICHVLRLDPYRFADFVIAEDQGTE